MSLRVFRCNFLLLWRILVVLIILIFVLFCKKYPIQYTVSDDDGLDYLQSLQNLKVSENQVKLNITIMSSFIETSNREEIMINCDTFGNITEETIIIVILVDKYSSNLEFLLASLSQVRGIEETLIIFSHSYFDENIDSMIKSVDFCRVLQIYYPYSIQTHREEFPGYDPKDCPYDFNLKSGVNCTGSLFPDIRGHYRNPSRAESKHHWWWTANSVFENLSVTSKHTGLVIFTEVDSSFMKDFIYMAFYMKNVADSFSESYFLSMGSDIILATKKVKPDIFYSIELVSWDPKKHSRALAFDMSLWNSIVSHYDIFCTVDDVSWLRSLYYVSVNRRDGKRFKTISAKTPRVYKTDYCSSDIYNFFGYRCNLLQNVLRVMNFEKCYEEDFFPSHLELYINIEMEDEEDIIFDYSESEGGWADPRDWSLCRNMTAGKIKKIIMDMKNELHGP